MSHITFKAQDVSYNKEFDGQLVQVKFDANIDKDSIEITKPYLLISFDFEPSPSYHYVEWSDGKEFDGGAKIKKYKLKQHSFQVDLENNISFIIEFTAKKSVYDNIERVLGDLNV